MMYVNVMFVVVVYFNVNNFRVGLMVVMFIVNRRIFYRFIFRLINLFVICFELNDMNVVNIYGKVLRILEFVMDIFKLFVRYIGSYDCKIMNF